MNYWRSWHFKNITFFVISIIFIYFLSQVESFKVFLIDLGVFGYFGAFVAGVLFVSTFTVAIGILILSVLAKTLSPIEIGLIAGLGAAIGDFMIFSFVKNNLTKELSYLYRKLDKGNHIKDIFYSRYFSWTLPVLGAIIIASPFPDEFGVSLMGISKMKNYKFFITSFVLNSIGIFLLVLAILLIEDKIL
ncbi:MAG TPA: hypothetical protein VFD45_02755 [Patescibacteria group bacterium]|nr:hypothetical protein [Patescibacteria group bacterium]